MTQKICTYTGTGGWWEDSFGAIGRRATPATPPVTPCTFWWQVYKSRTQTREMSLYAPPASSFAYTPVPMHTACYAQQVQLAAPPSGLPTNFKSKVGTAFETAAQSEDAKLSLGALRLLVIDYVRSMMSKYKTLKDNRTQQRVATDDESKHLQLQKEFALLHEIIDIKHDLQKLARKYAGMQELVSKCEEIDAICTPLL